MTGTGTRWALFAIGAVALAVAFAPPLEAAADTSLAAHMVQHMIAIAVAGPLIAFAPVPGAVPRALRHPVVVWTVAMGTLWAWHAPALFLAGLDNPALHVLEHATFLAGSVLFWRTIVHPDPGARLSPGAALAVIFAATLGSGALGALLTFASVPLYPGQWSGTLAGTLSPLEDQQLAGVVMWVPGGIVYLGAAAAVFVRWLRALERASDDRPNLDRMGTTP